MSKKSFFNKKSFNIKIFSKSINPKYTEYMNTINSGWDTLDTMPKKYIKNWNNKQVSFYVPSLKLGKLLIDLFFIVFPFIISSIIITSKKDVDFDIFRALESFANMQTSNTLDGFNEIDKALKSFNNNDFTFSMAEESFSNFNIFAGVGYSIKGVVDGIYYIIKFLGSIIALFVYMISDAVSNVIAFVSLIFGL